LAEDAHPLGENAHLSVENAHSSDLSLNCIRILFYKEKALWRLIISDHRALFLTLK
jgi:hypothetical protein